MTVARKQSVSRGGMAPENVTVLVLAALAVGLIIGQAVGRRQGLTVRKVELPVPVATAAAPAAGEAGADSDAMMKATAPKDPQSVDEARQLVAQMGDSDAQSLIDLGNRKFSHKHYFLAIGFFEKALSTDPNRPEVWCDLAAAFRAVKDPASAAKALTFASLARPASDSSISRSHS